MGRGPGNSGQLGGKFSSRMYIFVGIIGAAVLFGVFLVVMLLRDFRRRENLQPAREVVQWRMDSKGNFVCPGCGWDGHRLGKDAGGNYICPSCGWHAFAGRQPFPDQISQASLAGFQRPCVTPQTQTEQSAQRKERALFQSGLIPAGAGYPTPLEQNAAGKELVEGHWLGMELIPLTGELAREYGIPPATLGLLVDEVSLEAAESGLLAGDVVQSINNYPTPDIKEFTEATRRVAHLKEAQIRVFRRGRVMALTIRSERTLGFSQNESAQPIRPGAISPHRSRGRPCTACHIIMQTGGQLPTDAGDILPDPAPITRNSKAPHGYKGPCNSCHQVK